MYNPLKNRKSNLTFIGFGIFIFVLSVIFLISVASIQGEVIYDACYVFPDTNCSKSEQNVVFLHTNSTCGNILTAFYSTLDCNYYNNMLNTYQHCSYFSDCNVIHIPALNYISGILVSGVCLGVSLLIICLWIFFGYRHINEYTQL